MSKMEWAVGIGSALLAIRLLTACGAHVEPAPLPEGCEVMADYIRVQICPNQPVFVQCRDVASTNPAPGLCAGPDWTEGKQETGNGWCCQLDERFTIR